MTLESKFLDEQGSRPEVLVAAPGYCVITPKVAAPVGDDGVQMDSGDGDS
ncbi:hypothetical protein ACFTSF_37670 [Kribbella sp. NPDC056951]